MAQSFAVRILDARLDQACEVTASKDYARVRARKRKEKKRAVDGLLGPSQGRPTKARVLLCSWQESVTYHGLTSATGGVEEQREKISFQAAKTACACRSRLYILIDPGLLHVKSTLRVL